MYLRISIFVSFLRYRPAEFHFMQLRRSATLYSFVILRSIISFCVQDCVLIARFGGQFLRSPAPPVQIFRIIGTSALSVLYLHKITSTIKRTHIKRTCIKSTNIKSACAFMWGISENVFYCGRKNGRGKLNSQ